VQIGLGPDTESQSGEYRAINPLGQIPVLETEDGRFICQSNAILWYLAEGSPLLPAERFQQAIVLQWMFFEQYELEPNLAMSRWICHLKNLATERAEELTQYHAGGYRALDIMEAVLADSTFIVSNSCSVADIALFAYTHNCDQGQYSLKAYPGINAWIKRIQAMPGFLPMSEQFSRFDYD
jgi:glutathione S-transferase